MQLSSPSSASLCLLSWHYWAIREVLKDRKISNAPFLAFEPGGSRYIIEFTDIEAEEKKDLGLPEEATRVREQTVQYLTSTEHSVIMALVLHFKV
ncbi:MAG: hypothetical protein PHV74_03855 [Dehalococcoidia bacterium]|nr:hypothetical protein [Dehalococcoidia bacterium]